MFDPECCFVGCQKAAEYEVWPMPSQTPDDYTHACAEHLVAMFDDRDEQHVHRLPRSPAAPEAKETER